MSPPTPSHHDDKGGPIFVKANLAHHTKRKADGSPSVSIKGLPVGIHLLVEGPGPTEKAVLFIYTEGTKQIPVKFDCHF